MNIDMIYLQNKLHIKMYIASYWTQQQNNAKDADKYEDRKQSQTHERQRRDQDHEKYNDEYLDKDAHKPIKLKYQKLQLNKRFEKLWKFLRGPNNEVNKYSKPCRSRYTDW